MAVPREGRIRVKIYYEDTDSLGIVYYANYLKYLERGRTELFGTGATPITEWSRLGFSVAVYKVTITYRAPARLGDELEVVSRRLPGGSDYRLKLQQLVERAGTVITEAEVELVCLDERFELREFPPEMLAGL
jgi:acyl-CoA thioester hydrolase